MVVAFVSRAGQDIPKLLWILAVMIHALGRVRIIDVPSDVHDSAFHRRSVGEVGAVGDANSPNLAVNHELSNLSAAAIQGSIPGFPVGH